MAKYLNVDVSTVCRLEARAEDEPEPGPIARLLDFLEGKVEELPNAGDTPRGDAA